MRDERVRLRAVRTADLAVFFAQEQDEEAARLANFAPREREAFMSHWSDRVLGDATGRARAVTVSGELAGNVLAWWDGQHRYLGYWLGREFWGRGVGTAAVRLFLNEEQVRPLWADPVERNVASVRLLERLGFQRVRTLDEEGGRHVLLTLR